MAQFMRHLVASLRPRFRLLRSSSKKCKATVSGEEMRNCAIHEQVKSRSNRRSDRPKTWSGETSTKGEEALTWRSVMPSCMGCFRAGAAEPIQIEAIVQELVHLSDDDEPRRAPFKAPRRPSGNPKCVDASLDTSFGEAMPPGVIRKETAWPAASTLCTNSKSYRPNNSPCPSEYNADADDDGDASKRNKISDWVHMDEAHRRFKVPRLVVTPPCGDAHRLHPRKAGTPADCRATFDALERSVKERRERRLRAASERFSFAADPRQAGSEARKSNSQRACHFDEAWERSFGRAEGSPKISTLRFAAMGSNDEFLFTPPGMPPLPSRISSQFASPTLQTPFSVATPPEAAGASSRSRRRRNRVSSRSRICVPTPPVATETPPASSSAATHATAAAAPTVSTSEVVSPKASSSCGRAGFGVGAAAGASPSARARSATTTRAKVRSRGRARAGRAASETAPPSAQGTTKPRREKCEKQDPVACASSGAEASEAMVLKLAKDLSNRRKDPFAKRKRYFMAQCLKWHPDKNADNELLAKEMFQLLQEKKQWFLAET